MENEEPPCGDCGKPDDLEPDNFEIVKLWARCNNFERESSDMSGMPKKLRTCDILPVCESYDCTRDQMEMILLMESIVFPFIFQTAKESQERKK